MHLAGMSAAYGPQLPCCADSTAAAASALVGGSGPACDPNCLPTSGTDQGIIERMQAALDALLHGQQTGTPAPSSQWFPGVSNSLVVAVGVGLGAILLLGRRR